MKRIIQLLAVLAVATGSMWAQDVWKGLDMTRTTEAFNLDVPAGTDVLIVQTYCSSKKFGGEPTEGSLESTKIYEFDDKGYIVSDGRHIMKMTKKKIESDLSSDVDLGIYTSNTVDIRKLVKY